MQIAGVVRMKARLTGTTPLPLPQSVQYRVGEEAPPRASLLPTARQLRYTMLKKNLAVAAAVAALAARSHAASVDVARE